MIAMATKSNGGKGGYCAVAVPLKIASAPVYKDIPPEEEHNASQKRAGNYCSALLNHYIPDVNEAIKNISFSYGKPYDMLQYDDWVGGSSFGLAYFLLYIELFMGMTLRRNIAVTGSIDEHEQVKPDEQELAGLSTGVLELKLNALVDYNREVDPENQIKTVILPKEDIQFNAQEKELYSKAIAKYKNKFNLRIISTLGEIFPSETTEFEKSIFFDIYNEPSYWGGFMAGDFWYAEDDKTKEDDKKMARFIELSRSVIWKRLEELILIGEVDFVELFKSAGEMQKSLVAMARNQDKNKLANTIEIITKSGNYYTQKYLYQPIFSELYHEYFLKNDNNIHINDVWESVKECIKKMNNLDAESKKSKNAVYNNFQDISVDLTGMSLNSIRFLDNIAGTNHNFGMQLFHDSVVYGNIYQIYDLLKEGGEDIISMLYARAWSEIYKFLDLYQFPFKDNDGQIYKKRISGVQPVPLKIEVDIEKLSKIQFSIDNDQLAGVTLPDGIESPEKLSKNIIENPLLLWQKSRDLPRYYRSSNFKPENCEFSKMPDSSLIEYLFSYEDMDIVLNPGELYSNCKIRWNNKFKWPASIDAYFLLNTLLKHGYAQKQIRTMADIGCGTGVIGICLALWNENVQELMCSDIDDILLKVATYNANMNLAEIGRSGFTFNSRRTSGIQFLISEKTKYDVLILTPPYLPQPQELDDESSFLSKFTDGTALLENIIRRGLSVADELILEFSSMAKLEFDREIKELGEKYKIKTAKLGEMKVPLRLPRCMPFHPDDYGLDDDHEEFNNVLKDYNKKVEYHQKILIKDRNSLKMLEKRNFKYYHTLYAYSVTR